jgi:phosphatidylglycerol lysyltransferase
MALSTNLKRTLPALVSLAIIIVAGLVLLRAFRDISLTDVATRFAAIPAASLWLAAGFTALLLLSLAIYEVAMLRYIRSGLPDAQPFLTALAAYPIGHAVGFGALSGGAVRFRIYAAAGLSSFDIGKVVVLSFMPYAAGLGLLCGISLIADATEAGRLLPVDAGTASLVGWVLVAAHLAYVGLVLKRLGPLRLRWFEVQLPTPRMTALQYALGLVDAVSAIAVLYVLLPSDAAIGFLPFAAVYVLAIVAGLLSSVPAGLGVFESMLLLMLRDVPPDALLGAVLAYRLVYELVPFIIGALLFVGWEAWSRRHLFLGRRD